MKINPTISVLLALLLCCIGSGFAQKVRKSETIEMSRIFLVNHARAAGYQKDFVHVDTVSNFKWDDQNLINLVSFKNGGWVITSADKRFYPVLAYSFSGHLDANNIPENCMNWLDCYARQMTDALVSNGPFYPGMPQLWDKMLIDESPGTDTLYVEPLLRSVWDQLGYHNHMCPADPDGINGFVPVGCVPLAMAQLMYYFRFPDSGSGSASYTPPYQQGIYGEQFADFENTIYRWNHMTDICREENDATATLCYHAGVSVEVSYMPEAAGSNVNKVPDALAGHFKYLTDDYLPRDEVAGTEEWIGLLMENLQNRQPVIYRSSAGFGGHVYVCDGFQDSTHFHFNWGWGGAYNGFYYIDDLTPGGIQINYQHGAVFNIYPDTTQYAYPQSQEFTLLTNNVGSFEDGSGPEKYQNDLSATWLIQPSDTSMTNILLEFTMMDTEAGTDLIKVYDGADTLAPPARVFSGHELPEPYHSSSSSLLVAFHSDEQLNGNGFHANYYGYQLPFCGETITLTDPTGVLEDGSHYHNYSSNSDCSWLIAPEISPVDSISNVIINIPVFDLASGDTLIFYDGDSDDSDLLGAFWKDNSPPQLVSSGNEVFIEFRTNDEAVAQGWALYWDYVLPEYCSDTLVFNDFNGQISDGSGEKKYVENSDCYFLIDVPEAENISLEFTGFDLENDYDYLKIFNPDNPGQELIKLSGTDLPIPLQYPFNSLLIYFHSDYSMNFQGFGLNYSASVSGMDEPAKMFSVYPNPVMDLVTINSEILPFSGGTLKIVRPDGTTAFSGNLTSRKQVFNLEKIPSGTYLVKLKFDDLVLTKKMIKL